MHFKKKIKLTCLRIQKEFNSFDFTELVLDATLVVYIYFNSAYNDYNLTIMKQPNKYAFIFFQSFCWPFCSKY
jgi:hypothetical protein